MSELGLVTVLADLWRNAGTYCHLCGLPGMKEPRDTECRPHDCPHGIRCARAPNSPSFPGTAICAQCNARVRLGDVLAEKMRGGKIKGE